MTHFRTFTISALLTISTLALAVPIKALAMPDSQGECREMAHKEGHGGHGRHAGMAGEPMPPYLRGLKLSESQRDQIFELMHEKMPQLRNTAKQARQSVEQLRTQALSDSYDSAKARSQADGAGRAHAEMLSLRAEIDQKVFAILNAEQRQKLAAKIAAKP